MSSMRVHDVDDVVHDVRVRTRVALCVRARVACGVRTVCMTCTHVVCARVRA